jgi:protein-tyrosine-phosphatase
MRILFVCAGNLCRSPFAEGLARRLASERGLDLEFESAGEIAYEGSSCPRDALDAARWHGVDLSAHRARRLTPERQAAADEVVPLFDVPDPIGRGPDAYRVTYERLHQRVDALLDRWGGAG